MNRYFVGVDLGQSRDYTAIAVVERAERTGAWDPVSVRLAEGGGAGAAVPGEDGAGNAVPGGGGAGGAGDAFQGSGWALPPGGRRDGGGPAGGGPVAEGAAELRAAAGDYHERRAGDPGAGVTTGFQSAT